MNRRGEVIYKTLGHLARCTDCQWKGKFVNEVATKQQVALRNRSACEHARHNKHRVIVDIRRVFDRRMESR